MKTEKTPRQTKAQKKGAVIGQLRRIIDKIDLICEEIGNADIFQALQKESSKIDCVIDKICEI